MQEYKQQQLNQEFFKQKCINFYHFLRSLSQNNIKQEVLNNFNEQQQILQLDQSLEVSHEKIMSNIYVLLNYSDLSTDANVSNYIDQFLGSLSNRDYITQEHINKLKRYLQYFSEIQQLMKQQ